MQPVAAAAVDALFLYYSTRQRRTGRHRGIYRLLTVKDGTIGTIAETTPADTCISDTDGNAAADFMLRDFNQPAISHLLRAIHGWRFATCVQDMSWMAVNCRPVVVAVPT